MDAAPGVSPSFNSYFNNKFAEMAARVVGEFDYHDEYIFNFENDTELPDVEDEEQNSNQITEEENEEFEFTFAPKGSDNSELLSPISAGEIFQNGLIRPAYPLFNRDLLTEKEHDVPKRRIRIPLRKLFFEERETALTTSSSSSSSESENMDAVPVDTYCLWQPDKTRVEKSSSTGSDSKRWRFSDLLHRSKSDGSDKDRLVILRPINQSKVKQTPVGGGKSKTAPPPSLPRPRNRSGGENKGHLTYRQELVGFFGRVM